MREILFRGKRKANGKWIYGDYFRSKINNTELGIRVIHSITFFQNSEEFSYAIDPDTLGQYTGLTDKNGKKIFEGDILEQVLEDDDCVIRAFIVWHGSGWAFKEKRFSPDLILSCSECEPYEIIGNIHDNFELLDNSELLEDKL